MPTRNSKLESACTEIKELINRQPELHQLMQALAKEDGGSDESEAATAFLKLVKGNNYEQEGAIRSLTDCIVDHQDWITGNAFASDHRQRSLAHDIKKLFELALQAIKATYCNQPPENQPRVSVASSYLGVFKNCDGTEAIWDLKCICEDSQFHPSNLHVVQHTSKATHGAGSISFGELSLKQIQDICNKQNILWTILDIDSQAPTIRIYLPDGRQTLDRLRQAVEEYKKQLKDSDQAQVAEGKNSGCLRPSGLTAKQEPIKKSGDNTNTKPQGINKPGATGGC